MWDEEDVVGRLIQGLFGIALLGIAVLCVGVALGNEAKSWPDFAVIAFLFLAIPFSARCLWYAVTGRNDVDRNGF